MKKFLTFTFLIFLLQLAVVAQQAQRPDPQPAPETKENFKLGVAGYTFHKFDLQTTLETLKRCDVHYLCIKDFHLPIESTDEEIAAFHAKCAEYGVKGYAVGPLYMRSKEDIDKYFEYAKRVGVNTIVGVPNYDLLPYVEEKVKEYGFFYAIHLHGPDIDIYQDADEVWEKTKDLDPRMGMCLDIGHDTRNGKDPVADLKKYHSRVFDIHLKDVTGTTKLGYSVEVGRGIIDFPAFVKMVREVNYTGVISLEHERNMDNPFMGIAESIGYFRAMIVATR
ncbi:sugar phosphate isomerase/epimerase [Maribellus sp. CM-23]|uniref:sugar phosphate isomerase/epimerase family protein n=1 Tax=Maribellus sp. CM-23 TaxID=2781026 RepID=UPI001F45E803|nr:sugar phosphate isomerase/epimerase family protein [Maribellus sp. CM-23]MCE4562750.1 sugar phosphate isomerase/epimerase [Maribellus sp. CM-23]